MRILSILAIVTILSCFYERKVIDIHEFLKKDRYEMVITTSGGIIGPASTDYQVSKSTDSVYVEVRELFVSPMNSFDLIFSIDEFSKIEEAIVMMSTSSIPQGCYST